MSLVANIQGLGKYVAYYPNLNHITGNVLASILLHELIFQTQYQADPAGVSIKEIKLMELTGFSQKELRSARARLASKGLTVETAKGLPKRNFYRVNSEVVDSLWSEYQCTHLSAVSLAREEKKNRLQSVLSGLTGEDASVSPIRTHQSVLSGRTGESCQDASSESYQDALSYTSLKSLDKSLDKSLEEKDSRALESESESVPIADEPEKGESQNLILCLEIQEESKVKTGKRRGQENQDTPQPPPQSEKQADQGIIIDLWNDSARFTVCMPIGKLAQEKKLVVTAFRQTEKIDELPKIIKLCFCIAVKMLRTNILESQKLEQSTFVSSEALEEGLILPDTFSIGSDFSIRLAINQEPIWDGTARFVVSTQTSTLSSTLIGSFLGLKAARTWLEICRSYAPTATDAKLMDSITGSTVKEITLTPSKPPKLTEADFDRFWEIVKMEAGKSGKAASLKKFLAIKGVSADTLIQARIQQQEWHRANRGVLKYLSVPNNWLRDGRWEDEMKSSIAPSQHSSPADLSLVRSPSELAATDQEFDSWWNRYLAIVSEINDIPCQGDRNQALNAYKKLLMAGCTEEMLSRSLKAYYDQSKERWLRGKQVFMTSAAKFLENDTWKVAIAKDEVKAPTQAEQTNTAWADRLRAKHGAVAL